MPVILTFPYQCLRHWNETYNMPSFNVHHQSKSPDIDCTIRYEVVRQSAGHLNSAVPGSRWGRTPAESGDFCLSLCDEASHPWAGTSVVCQNVSEKTIARYNFLHRIQKSLKGDNLQVIKEHAHQRAVPFTCSHSWYVCVVSIGASRLADLGWVISEIGSTTTYVSEQLETG